MSDVARGCLCVEAGFDRKRGECRQETREGEGCEDHGLGIRSSWAENKIAMMRRRYACKVTGKSPVSDCSPSTSTGRLHHVRGSRTTTASTLLATTFDDNLLRCIINSTLKNPVQRLYTPTGNCAYISCAIMASHSFIQSYNYSTHSPLPSWILPKHCQQVDTPSATQ